MGVQSGQSYLDKLDDVLRRNKLLWLFFTLQFVVIIILVVGYLNLKGGVVIHVEIPPKIYYSGQLRIGSKKADQLYFKMWGAYIAKTMSSYTPETIENKYSEILYMLHPSKLNKYHHDFMAKVDKVKDALMSNKFYMTGSYIVMNKDLSQGTYTAVGVSRLNIGDGLSIEDYSCSYTIVMRLESYHLFVENLKEDCKLISKREFDNAKKGK